MLKCKFLKHNSDNMITYNGFSESNFIIMVRFTELFTAVRTNEIMWKFVLVTFEWIVVVT